MVRLSPASRGQPLLRPSGTAPGPICCDSVVNRTVQIHAWLLAALLFGALAMTTFLLVMMHVHAVDVAYIARTHRPIVLVPTGASCWWCPLERVLALVGQACVTFGRGRRSLSAAPVMLHRPGERRR